MQTALVTGASRGIGRAIAARLLADGWVVFNLDIAPPEVEPDLGDRWVEVELDSVEATKNALHDVLLDGPVSALVNKAAIGRMSALEDTSVKDFDESVAVNMRAPMLCAQAVIPGMKARGFGRIVNIASRAHLGKALRTTLLRIRLMDRQRFASGLPPTSRSSGWGRSRLCHPLQ